MLIFNSEIEYRIKSGAKGWQNDHA